MTIRPLKFVMADREGFEPSIPFPVYSLSRGALSTTQPPVLVRLGLAGRI